MCTGEEPFRPRLWGQPCPRDCCVPFGKEVVGIVPLSAVNTFMVVASGSEGLLGFSFPSLTPWSIMRICSAKYISSSILKCELLPGL